MYFNDLIHNLAKENILSIAPYSKLDHSREINNHSTQVSVTDQEPLNIAFSHQRLPYTGRQFFKPVALISLNA